MVFPLENEEKGKRVGKAGGGVGTGKGTGKSMRTRLSKLPLANYPLVSRRFLKFRPETSPNRLSILKGGGKIPTPKISALLRKRPVLLRANFVLTKDRKRPYYGHFCGKLHREGSCSKAAGGP